MGLLPSYWSDPNGSVMCVDHVGNYLRSALESNPALVEVDTPLGLMVRMDDDEVADFVEFVHSRIGDASICEECRGGW